MKKILLLIAALCISCAAQNTQTRRTATAAFISPVYTDTLTLSNSTVTTAAKATNTCTTLGVSVVSTGTATGTYTIEYSNDGATFDTYTLSTTPPAAAGAGQTFGITLPLFEFGYERVKFTGTGGSGSATVVTQLKGC